MTAYYIKITNKKGVTMGSCSTHSFRRFKNYLQAYQNELGGINIKFTYGTAKDQEGVNAKFINQGEYKTRKAALLAIKAFHEVEWNKKGGQNG